MIFTAFNMDNELPQWQVDTGGRQRHPVMVANGELGVRTCV